ncbi:MAG: cytochrome C assembly family protein, partial [Gammaproteobacteria bacterium]
LGNVIGLIGWLTAILALGGSAKPAIRGLTGILLVVAALMSLGTALPVATHFTRSMTWQLQAHVMMSMLAYSMLGIGAALALLIAAQDKRLRQRRPTGWLRVLPPMETLEQSLFGALTIGFLLLTLAVFSGLIFVENFFAQHLVHKSVLSILAWLIFAILLAGRWRYGWRGKRAVHWTLVGFAILALAYFGSKLVLEAMLGRQWG